MTVTAAAALSGLTFQPATSSRTSRKSTAASAAETSASASAGRSGEALAGARGRRRRARARARRGRRSRPAAATGTWKTKIARQSKASVSAPPTAGPSAVANTAAPSHSRRPGPAAAEQVEDGGQPGRGADRLRAARDEQRR